MEHRGSPIGSGDMKRDLSIADRVGLGLAAGLVGTIVMTLSQNAEMAVTKRPPSATPARAVEKVSGVDLESKADEVRASMPIHVGYGIALGSALAALDRLPPLARTATFFGVAWGGGAALLRALKLAPPPTRQSPAALATDIGHHLVYAASSGVAYSLLRRLSTRPAAG